ncbi:MAG: DUF6089 family protein [Nonlabens sp.]
MKNHMRLVVLSLCFVVFTPLCAQTYEVGLIAGGSNVIGDVGSTRYISPNEIAVGAIFKWNRSNRHSFRASFIATTLSGNDLDSDDISRELRGLDYSYGFYEASVGIEYTFWDWELYSGTRQFTPYLYAGVAGFRQVSYRLNDLGTDLRSYDNAYGVAIPLTLGVKYTLTTRLVLAAEVGARFAFTDNLDGSNPTGDFKDREDLQFGNLNNNDWYMMSGITLTYTFGRMPCYCNF